MIRLPRIAVVMCAAMTLSATVAAPVASAQWHVIEGTRNVSPVQGAEVIIGGNGSCTLGYNDHAKGVSYISAHCGSEGDKVQVITADGSRSAKIGTFHPSTKYTGSANSRFESDNDWAYITWDSDIKMGINRFTTDARVDIDTVKKGDKVCFHGNTSHGQTDAVTCGKYVKNLDNTFYFDSKSGDHGDSGGPVWVERDGSKAFIGVHSGNHQVQSPVSGEWGGLNRAAVPADGPGHSNWDHTKLILEYHKIAVGTIGGIPIIPGSAESSSENASSEDGNSSEKESSSEEGSSTDNLSTDQIIGIVMAVVTLLGMIAPAAQSFLR